MKVQAIFFDVGNIIINVNWQKALDLMGLKITLEEAHEVIGNSQTFRDFERGHTTPKEFHSFYCETMQIDTPLDTFATAWNLAIDGLVQDVEAVIGKIRPEVKVYALTNTNEIHFDYFRNFPIFERFHHLFASHHLQARKPEDEIYKQALQHSGFQGPDVLFVDDLHENLNNARKLGIHSEHCCCDSGQLEKILRKYQLVE